MNKPLVLVVEDDTPVRNLITTTLKTHEYRYLSAQNGASAVMEALSHNPDIVLLDLGLPDMDGVEIIRKIRSWSNMPIIVISARTEDSDKSWRWMPGRTIISPSPFPWMNCWRGCE
jgi:two-component system KDP operon response regulator KdpE